jgi:hypothetical protein
MLTLIEDAITHEGEDAVVNTGSYYRLVWHYGLRHEQVMQYVQKTWQLYSDNPSESKFPEWILRDLDEKWMTEIPQPNEMSSFVINKRYCKWLLDRLGKGDGKALEYLTHYLIGCIPGCRAYHRKITPSTDYDVVGIFEGPLVDYRSEIGRYFVCECKDYKQKPANYTHLTKLCRVLDSVKAKFGIMVSKKGISGQGKRIYADLERMKVYQDRGVVIVVVDENDPQMVADGENFVSMLREKYMDVRLDLKKKQPTKKQSTKKQPTKKQPTKKTTTKKTTSKMTTSKKTTKQKPTA